MVVTGSSLLEVVVIGSVPWLFVVVVPASVVPVLGSASPVLEEESSVPIAELSVVIGRLPFESSPPVLVELLQAHSEAVSRITAADTHRLPLSLCA